MGAWEAANGGGKSRASWLGIQPQTTRACFRPLSCTHQAERRAAEEEARREKEKEEALRTGNPLLAIAGGGGAGGSGGGVDFGVKRRWDEDVVFKNTTRGEVKVGGGERAGALLLAGAVPGCIGRGSACVPRTFCIANEMSTH